MGFRLLSISLIICALAAPAAWADPTGDAINALRQQVAQLSSVVEQLNNTVQSQQARIAELESGKNPNPQLAGGAASSSSPSGLSLSSSNPEIGVVADMVGQLSQSSQDGEGNDKISVREIELIFGSAIDPYSRFDSTITFSDFENPDIEEAYITHWGLPGEIKARLGRMRPKIGKASAVHSDVLDTVDEPLVVSEYLGKEGLFRTGLELSGFLPVPWTSVAHELTAGIMEGGVGEDGTLFGQTRRRPSYYAHLKNFWDINDTTNAELGATYLAGSSDADANVEVNALGLDATLVHFFTPTNKLKWQNEAYFQNRREMLIVSSGSVFDPSPTPWGFYSLLDYRLSQRFGIGGRIDYVEPVGLDPATLVRHADTGFSGYFTFYQSEFSRWRLQFRHTDFAAGGDDNAVFLQGTVAIGVHKHALQ